MTSFATRAATLAVLLQLASVVSGAGLVSFGKIGGRAGTAFTDYAAGTRSPLASVTVVVCDSTSLIGQIQVAYIGTPSPVTVIHGNDCVGTSNTMTLGKNDYVMAVTGWQNTNDWSAVVSALRFVTNNTATGILTTYGPWGTTLPSIKNFTATAPDGYAFTFLSGHATASGTAMGTGVNSLVFNFAPLPQETGAWGGDSGSSFSDAGFENETLASVTVYTNGPTISMIELKYRNGSSLAHGQWSATAHTLVLAPGEHINEVWACVGATIHDLFFSTSLDQMMDVGIQTGDPWHYYNAPNGVGLVYLTGKTSDVLNQLNFHFGPAV